MRVGSEGDEDEFWQAGNTSDDDSSESDSSGWEVAPSDGEDVPSESFASTPSPGVQDKHVPVGDGKQEKSCVDKSETPVVAYVTEHGKRATSSVEKAPGGSVPDSNAGEFCGRTKC